MPRPTGWKPLSYSKIAEICGRLTLGHKPVDLAQELGVPLTTIRNLRLPLLKLGAAPHLGRDKLPAEVDANIQHLIRTTSMTNHQIRKRCSLNWGGSVRSRRQAYHEELRRQGLPVPLCKCGDEFQHAHRCRFMRSCPKPLNEFERDEVVAELVSGVSPDRVRARYGISFPALNALIKSLKPAQRKKRRLNIAQRIHATRRRKKVECTSADLHARLDASLPQSIPPEVRSEILQEMALAILSGSVAEERAIKQLRSFTSKAYRQLSDPWRNVSLDAERDGCSLADSIEDDSALGAFDEMDEMLLA